jgi:hypothetical protein
VQAPQPVLRVLPPRVSQSFRPSWPWLLWVLALPPSKVVEIR